MTKDFQNLSDQKTRQEIEKLSIEVEHLKSPFKKLANWVPILIAIAGVATTITQWQKSSLNQEKSSLQVETATFKLEQLKVKTNKQFSDLKIQLEQAERDLSGAKFAEEKALKNRDLLQEQQTGLQQTLSSLQNNITKSRASLGALNKRIEASEAVEELKLLSQTAVTDLADAEAGLEKAIEQQRLQIQELIQKTNSNEKNIRIASTEKFIEEFSHSSLAIRLVLAMFDDGNIQELSADGRINLLIFLNATPTTAWDQSLAQTAKEKLDFIEARQILGIRIGNTTRKWLDRLVKKMAQVSANL